jgi:periplasmic divalent cation tolerance protein
VGAPLVVLVTFPSWEAARSISAVLVREGLAACVNLLPGAESVYRWEGKVEVAPEVVGLVKTTTARVEELEQRYLSLHPYEVPEFLTLGAVNGSRAYLDWLSTSVAAVKESEQPRETRAPGKENPPPCERRRGSGQSTPKKTTGGPDA